VRDQIAKYAGKLLADRSAHPGDVAFAAHDDTLLSEGDPGRARLCARVLSSLSCLGLVAARPSLPFADFLVRRAKAEESRVVPQDTETRTFLHDIPFLRREELGEDAAARISSLLGNRKGMIAEGLGIVAAGTVTIEQAYINYSSVFHAAFVKYLLDLLADGFLLPGEKEAFESFRRDWLRPLSAEGLAFRRGPLEEPEEVFKEIAAVGRYTVERGLVDSFFGNISCRAGGVIYISQTAASLDELPGRIDPVRTDNSSTTGITASSELLAHRRIYEVSGARTILHGHPKFAVVMSMLCEEKGCTVKDCWRDCDKVRLVIAAPRKAVVYGHGVFTVGRMDFAEAFRAMVGVENWCRQEYFRRLDEKLSG
jgi:ribulose-5-phosphate 4-epimerase/fuculose-1-phosphate aldolase